MKKGLLLTLILIAVFASIVYATTETPSIKRYTNFMGDNIHILRIEDLANNFGRQVDEMDSKLAEMEAKITELEKLQELYAEKEGQNVPAAGLAVQFSEVNRNMMDLQRSVTELKHTTRQMQTTPQEVPKKEDNLAYYIVGLLGLNGVLLILVSYVVLTKKPVQRQVKTAHEYIVHSLDEGVDVHEIKHELLKKGWTTREIEKAFKEI